MEKAKDEVLSICAIVQRPGREPDHSPSSSAEVKTVGAIIPLHSRSQWQHGLRLEPLSLVWALGSWVPNPLEACSSLCVYSMFVLSCVQAAALRRADPPSKESYRQCIGLLTYGAEPFLRSCQLCNHSGISQNFMEPESSSPYSQEPSTGPYPEPHRSSPYHPILSL
jgi:hypothetical protein